MNVSEYIIFLSVGMGLFLLFAFYFDFILFRIWKSDFSESEKAEVEKKEIRMPLENASSRSITLSSIN